MKPVLIGEKFDVGSGQGIYRYSGELFNALSKICPNAIVKETFKEGSQIKKIFFNTVYNFLSNFEKLGDIYHFMAPEVSLPLLVKKNSVVTIHDIIPLKIRERNWIYKIYFKIMIRIALRAKHIIAVSESTKRDICELFKVNQDKISVIYEGVNSKKFYPKKIKKKTNIFNIGYLGGLGKRKNVETILSVANKLKRLKNFKFRIAGVGPQLEKLKKIKKESNLENVEFLGKIPEEDLNAFYNSLDLFIFPSLYEGFGLPIVEAMACGIPVIASNKSSMPEIIGESGLTFPPKDIGEISKSIKRVLEDKRLRDMLRKKSIERSKNFCWENTAQNMLRVYEKILKNEKYI